MRKYYTITEYEGGEVIEQTRLTIASEAIAYLHECKRHYAKYKGQGDYSVYFTYDTLNDNDELIDYEEISSYDF